MICLIDPQDINDPNLYTSTEIKRQKENIFFTKL